MHSRPGVWMLSWAYTKDIPFLYQQAHVVSKSAKPCSPDGVEGWNKEETRRVSDAANDKLGSNEALPERSDRECDETEVSGATAPDVASCWGYDTSR